MQQVCGVKEQHSVFSIAKKSWCETSFRLFHNSPLRAQTPLILWRGSEGNSSQVGLFKISQLNEIQLHLIDDRILYSIVFFSYICSDSMYFQSDEDFQERRSEVENLTKKNADWMWDWSSRVENNPPKYVSITTFITFCIWYDCFPLIIVFKININSPDMRQNYFTQHVQNGTQQSVHLCQSQLSPSSKIPRSDSFLRAVPKYNGFAFDLFPTLQSGLVDFQLVVIVQSC